MDERAKALDDQLVKMGKIMMERYNIPDGSDESAMDVDANDDTAIAPLEAVGVPNQDKVCCIGRICNAVRIIRCD